MEGINQWLIELNKNSPVWYGIVTVLTMAGIGIIIAVATEIIFKIFRVKGERIDIHH